MVKKKEEEALYKIYASCYCYQKAGKGNYCIQFLSVSVFPHISMSLCPSNFIYWNWKWYLNEIFQRWEYHNIAEILLKLTLITNQLINQSKIIIGLMDDLSFRFSQSVQKKHFVKLAWKAFQRILFYLIK